jgi:DNA processing protein
VVLGGAPGLTADVLSAMLLRLEMAGRLETLPGGRYQRTA